MPNWTTNTIRVAGKPADLRAFLEAIKWEDTLFDFSRLTPMPDILKHTGCGRRTINGEEYTSWYVMNPAEPDPNKEHVRPFTPEEQAALKEIGHDSWYDWSTQNWGTKWPACGVRIESTDLEDGSLELSFRTAWSAPHPIFHKLHEMFPHLSFQCQWRNEDDQYESLHTLEFETAA